MSKHKSEESVGRKWEVIRYGVHSRVFRDDGTWSPWYGVNKFTDEIAANKQMEQSVREASSTVMDMGGGFTVGFGSVTQQTQFRVVRAVIQYETLGLKEYIPRRTKVKTINPRRK